MYKLRVPIQDLPDQFNAVQPNRIMIYDGDSACYVIASTVKTLKTAVRHFQMDVMTKMFLTKSEGAVVHLTAEGSRKAGRFLIKGEKQYQANRTGAAKPKMLEAVRQAVADKQNWLPEFSVNYHHDLEADDWCIIDAYKFKEHGVVVSADKDLRMTPYLFYEHHTGQVLAPAGFGSLWEYYTPAGAFRVHGHGLKFFWAQMLMGDSADNVAGLRKFNGKRIGPVTTYEVMQELCTEDATANFVLDAYRKIDQNPLPEGTMMWLYRTVQDSFEKYLQELNLSAENRAFIQDCSRRDWVCTEKPDTQREIT